MEPDRTNAGDVTSVEARWLGLIREHQASGQSVKVFCAARGLATSTFFAWRRKLVGGRGPRPGRFVELIARRGDSLAGRADGQEPFRAASSAAVGAETGAITHTAAMADTLATAGNDAGAVIELELREAHRPVLLLRRGFDPLLLRQVLAALAERGS